MRSSKATTSSKNKKRLQGKVCNQSTATWLCKGQYLVIMMQRWKLIWAYNILGNSDADTPASELNFVSNEIGKWVPPVSFRSPGFPGGSAGNESACNAGDLCSISVSGRSPEEGNGNPIQYSCLENFMDKRAWQATVHGVTKSWT